MNIIKEIPSKAAYIFRQPLLRKGKPIETCLFEADDLETTPHFGLFDNENLTGIISLFSKINPIFVEQNQAQIRGMQFKKRIRSKDLEKL